MARSKAVTALLIRAAPRGESQNQYWDCSASGDKPSTICSETGISRMLATGGVVIVFGR